MARLPKSIIKKYGISKKAWSVFRGQRSSTSKSSSTNKSRRRLNTMARRRRSSRRTTSRGFLSGAGSVVAPMLYGAGRQVMSVKLSPITSKIPLGEISDEVGMYLVAWGLKKMVFKQQGIIRSALSAGQMIELARIGEYIATSGFGGVMSTTSNGNGYVFA